MPPLKMITNGLLKMMSEFYCNDFDIFWYMTSTWEDGIPLSKFVTTVRMGDYFFILPKGKASSNVFRSGHIAVKQKYWENLIVMSVISQGFSKRAEEFPYKVEME